MFKKSRLSTIIDIGIPIVLIGIILAFILLSNSYTNGVRETYTKGFINLIEAAIETACTDEGLGVSAIKIIESINGIDNKASGVYLYEKGSDDLISLSNSNTHLYPYIYGWEDNDEIHQLVYSNERGYYRIKVGNSDWHVNFEWYLPSNGGGRQYLVLYAVDQTMFATPIIQHLRYLCIFIFMAYWIKVTYYDRSLYMKIIRENQKRLISKIEYNQIDASRYNDDDQK